MDRENYSMPAVESDALSFDPRRMSRTTRFVTIATLVLAYGLLVVMGHELREEREQLAIVWPSGGLLFVVLWFAPRRLWPPILAIQIAIEVAINLAWYFHDHLGLTFAFAAANSTDAVVGAWLQRRWVAEPAIPRVRQVLMFLASSALGAGTGACLGALVSRYTMADTNYWHEWQIWWAGNWLGTLATAPVALVWWIRVRIPALSTRHRSLLETAFIGGGLLAWTFWVFAAAPGALSTIFNLPTMILAALVLAAFRLPPRSVTLLAATVVMVAAYLSGRHLGPFAGDVQPFARVGALQIFLATLIVVTYLLLIALLEMRGAGAKLLASEERYRRFVALSTEAVWRIELRAPMPVNLSVEQQHGWLNEHAEVVECNDAFLDLCRQAGLAEPEARRWHANTPWSAVLDDFLGRLVLQQYSVDGLRFTINGDGHAATYLTAFSAEVADGHLRRVWGVAREITKLVDTTERLRLERERLREYVWELGLAEERARREVAVDLHDGIGQLLTALALNIGAARKSDSRRAGDLLVEAEAILVRVQSSTREVIADLSPPGLYDLGLQVALEWQAARVRRQHLLRTDLSLDLPERELEIEWRVFIFKIVRELVQNAAKHAKVASVDVKLRVQGDILTLSVSDRGAGFVMPPEGPTVPGQRFGLWSIADRVRAVGGQFAVETAPGQGCRVSISVPVTGGPVRARFETGEVERTVMPHPAPGHAAY